MGKQMHDSRKLFHIEMLDKDGDHWNEWVWADNEEQALEGVFLDDDSIRKEIRPATDYETDAWVDGNAEAMGAGLAEERLANWNGVAYALESFVPMVTKEVFQCAVCSETMSIDKASKLGEFYLSVRTPKGEQANKTILWHVCQDCAKA